MHPSGRPHSEETKTDRTARRRLRRWKRRARAAAPLLAVPAMLGLLILSVDLIEYQPGEGARPARPPSAIDERHAESGLQAFTADPQSVSALSIVDSSALESDALAASVVGSTTMPIDAAMPNGAPLSIGTGPDPARDAARFVDPRQAMPTSSSAPRAVDAIGAPSIGARAVR